MKFYSYALLALSIVYGLGSYMSIDPVVHNVLFGASVLCLVLSLLVQLAIVGFDDFE